MKQIPIRLGPLTLLLAVISICLTTLAILTFTTARADMRLAEKYAETVETRYRLESRGQALLADAAEAAENGTLERMGDPDGDGLFRQTFEDGDARLKIALRREGETVTVVEWKHERLWQEDTSLGQLWAGF